MNLRPCIAAATAATLLTFAAPGTSAQDEAPDPDLEELKSEIAALVDERDLPGVSIAIVDEDGPIWIDALGTADIENDVAADADTMFRIGSTSKMFVALAVLKLVEEGRLSLDDKLADLAPEIEFENRWEETDPIRIVHLLEHTTGWDDIHLVEYAHNDPTPATLKAGLDYHPHSRVSRWVPGSRMSYCNAGPPVAAYIVEKIVGQEFEEYIADQFFAPLGMATASYRLTEHVRTKGATLYTNGNQPEDYWHIIMRPSGSINASASDMARFLSFYLHRGVANAGSEYEQQLVSRDSLDRMEMAASTGGATAGLQVGYGLHNYTDTHNNWVFHGHNGGVNGGASDFAYLPEAGIGHAILVNSDDYETFGDIADLVRDYETRNLSFEISHDAQPVTDEHREIEGLYYPINPRQQAGHFIERLAGVQRLRFEDSKLVVQPLLGDEPDYFLPTTPDLYVAEQTGLVALARTVDPLAGDVVHLGPQVLKRTPAWLLYSQYAIAALWGFVIVTSVAWFLVWGVRRLRGRIPSGATIRVRTWPLLASASVIGTVFLFMLGFDDPFGMLGQPTAVSVGIMLSTILFAAFAVAGVYTAVKVRGEPMNRGTLWYSTLASVTHLAVAAYLLMFGVIGMATWA